MVPSTRQRCSQNGGWRRGQVLHYDTAPGAAIRRPSAAGSCFARMSERETGSGLALRHPVFLEGARPAADRRVVATERTGDPAHLVVVFSVGKWRRSQVLRYDTAPGAAMRRPPPQDASPPECRRARPDPGFPHDGDDRGLDAGATPRPLGSEGKLNGTPGPCAARVQSRRVTQATVLAYDPLMSYFAPRAASRASHSPRSCAPSEIISS